MKASESSLSLRNSHQKLQQTLGKLSTGQNALSPLVRDFGRKSPQKIIIENTLNIQT